MIKIKVEMNFKVDNERNKNTDANADNCYFLLFLIIQKSFDGAKDIEES
jgi:hypothetical protein